MYTLIQNNKTNKTNIPTLSKPLFFAFLYLLITGTTIAQVPFTCSDILYQYRSSDIYEIDIVNGTETEVKSGLSGLVNPRAYNVEDDFVYLYQANNIYQVDANFDRINKGTVTGGMSAEAGDFDFSGNLFIYATGQLKSIDVNNPPFTAKNYNITGAAGQVVGDIAYRAGDGKFYGVSNENELVAITITGDTTATMSKTPITGPLASHFSGEYASAWITQSGQLIVFEQYSGRFYQVDFYTYASTLVMTAVGGSLFNDGFSCPSTALPLELLYFEARTWGNNAVHLEWSTESEENVSHFDIQRSMDGKKWESIGEVGAYNLIGPNTYRFTDMPASGGQYYYQLKMIDMDESFSRSKKLSVKLESSRDFSVYPSPANEELKLNSSFESTFQISIYDLRGRLVHTQDIEQDTETINISQLVSGHYILKGFGEGQTKTTKFIKR